MKRIVSYVSVFLMLGLLGGGMDHLKTLTGEIDVSQGSAKLRQKTDLQAKKTRFIPARAYSGSGESESFPHRLDGSCSVSRSVVVVRLPRDRYPASMRHIKRAIRMGAPKVWHMDRAAASSNRAASLRGIESNSKLDRDEVPLASTREGGEGASVTYIPFSDNRGSGSFIGNAMSKYCDGQAFRVVAD